MKLIGYERGGTRDPWIFYRNGYFYHCYSHAGGIAVGKSQTIEGIATAEPVIVYVPKAENRTARNFGRPNCI